MQDHRRKSNQNLVAIAFISAISPFGWIFAGCTPAESTYSPAPNKMSTLEPAKAEQANVGQASSEQAVKKIAVKVSGMMCRQSCLKDVELLIGKQNDVETIELAKQQSEETIDNPVVWVSYRGELNQEKTTRALLEAGFEKVEYSASATFPE